MRLRHHAGTGLSFDNLGEVTALARGEWPTGAPVGEHWSVTEALPRLLALLDEVALRATFFVEGLNAELYPDALRELDAAGIEVHDVGLRRPTLDEVFLSLTGHAAEEAPESANAHDEPEKEEVGSR